MAKQIKGFCNLCDGKEPSIFKTGSGIEVGEKCHIILENNGAHWGLAITKTELLQMRRKRT